jgi:beta-phosphoglucomutase
MIKGVLFDLDGVLVSTDELHYKAWKKLANELHIMDFNKEDNKNQRGISRMASLEIVLNKGQKQYSDKEKEALADRKNQYYQEMLKEISGDAVLVGATETLRMLRERGILIGIGSVSKNAPLILERTGLRGYIDQISCGLDITKSKPDPEVFQTAAFKLKLKAEECLVVEDSTAGIIAAKAAQMRSLGVGPYYKTLGADYQSETLLSEVNWNDILSSK